MRRLVVLACGVAVLVLGISPVSATAAPLAGPVPRPSPAAPSASPAGSAAAVQGTGGSAIPTPGPAGSALPSAPDGPAAPAGAAVVDGAGHSGSLALDGAFARRGANACTWRVGSTGIEKTFTFAAGSYTMTSFRNTLVEPAREYVTAGAPSVEFRFTWDGQTLTGGSGGWSCTSGEVTKIDAGGAPALQLDVTLDRPTVRVVKHYVIYPKVAMVREWTDYANTDSQPHQLTQPSFLEQDVMGDTMAQTDLSYISSWSLQTEQLTADYARTISNSDDGGFLATSTTYQPWFSLFNRDRKDGIYAGFDYFGRWSVTFGQRDGVGSSLSMFMPNYDAPLSAGASISSPKAFDAVYQGDLDDMTNRILTWQYMYMWDYTRPPYFGAVRDEGPDYLVGSPTGPFGADADGQLQWMLTMTDAMASMGVDTYHRDHGWFDTTGDFEGEDFRIVDNYLKQHGMAKLIYYFAYDAAPESKIRTEHPEWFDSSSPCADGLIDMRIPAAKAWLLNKLITNAERWGDYEWRNDNCSMGDWPGDRQLAQDQAFRSVLQTFLDTRPGSGFHAVNWGGMQASFDYLRYADGSSMSDGSSYGSQYAGSMIYPTDKLSPPPEFYPINDCGSAFTFELMWSPDLQGDTADPQHLACARTTTDLYHYIVAQGVAGRWTHQYHPHASDDDSHWFQRLSWDGRRGVIVYKGGWYQDPPASAPATVFPKGLNPGQLYDVRFEYQAGVSQRLGSDLMQNGITLTAPAPGELVWLNLPGHPGSGTDHTPPAAPGKVTASAGTNFTEPGVEVRWTPARDNNWVTGYQVLRNGVLLDTVAKGTYYFDHTPAAATSATYSVKTVDGDGNVSTPATAGGGAPDSTFADDSSTQLSYTGQWGHQSSAVGPFSGTQSVTSGLPCHLACAQFSGTQGQNGWSFQEQSPPMCLTTCQQFSATQGQDGWSYQGKQDDGQWHDMNFYFPSFGWVGAGTTPDGNIDLSQFYGIVSATFTIPGVNHDTARAWTAAKDGTVDITSRAVPRDQQANVLTVTKNGETIAGPFTVAGNLADINVPGVPVTAGDVIRFEVQGAAQLSISGGVNWQANIDYQGDPPAPPIPPSYVDMPTYDTNADFFSDGSVWTSGSGSISGSQLQAGNLDVAREWTAPQDGTVDLISHATMNLADSSGQGATLTVTKNDAVIWGPQSLAAGDRNGIDINVPDVAVSAGDVIRFVVAAGSGVVIWDPDVVASGTQPPDPELASVSWSFTGNQVTWYTQVGTDRGVAEVLIDGQPDARIDLFSSNDTNWSVPIYTKTFTAVGPHTITIRTTGDLNPRSLGTGVQVDGFRAGARPVVVAEENSPLITYRGSGWARQADPAASGGYSEVSGNAGDTARFVFHGSFVSLTSTLCPACGEADVYLDGTYVTRIDTYGFRGPALAQAGVFQHSWPKAARHVLEIVATGTKNIRSTGTTVTVDNLQIGP
jgi:hypothetical protein